MFKIEVAYKKDNNYLIAFILNDTQEPKLILENNQERKFMEISKYPFSALSEIETELNENGIFIEPEFIVLDKRYYKKEEVDNLIK